ncbi:universal stress protein [uncultured Aquitalea sp.]|uniref:universal stress protein n=1 Tax=uncultured Aquitalea sp. TaxID=540272 RepID=UPI0025F53ADD|nr:universal stress protein [uncultured Aquitalea sp.]
MYQHIIVAVDGSRTAAKALHEAIRIAKSLQARLTLVNVVSLRDLAIEGVGSLDTHQLHEQAFRQARELLEAAEKTALNEGLTKVNFHIAESWEGGKDLAEVLIRFVENEAADLLVLGTHGRSGIAHLLLGSFAELVMRRTPCPLMVVRGDGDDDIKVD